MPRICDALYAHFTADHVTLIPRRITVRACGYHNLYNILRCARVFMPRILRTRLAILHITMPQRSTPALPSLPRVWTPRPARLRHLMTDALCMPRHRFPAPTGDAFTFVLFLRFWVPRYLPPQFYSRFGLPSLPTTRSIPTLPPGVNSLV